MVSVVCVIVIYGVMLMFVFLSVVLVKCLFMLMDDVSMLLFMYGNLISLRVFWIVLFLLKVLCRIGKVRLMGLSDEIVLLVVVSVKF